MPLSLAFETAKSSGDTVMPAIVAAMCNYGLDCAQAMDRTARDALEARRDGGQGLGRLAVSRKTH